MTGADQAGIGIAILAAGASTRLGRPKQLLSHRGTTLLRHAAQVALDAALGPVFVVLGASAEACSPALQGLDVRVATHDGWREGVGSTIRVAAAFAAADAGIGAIILMSCDQLHVTADDLRRLAVTWRETRAAAVGSAYGGTVGIPALFDRSQFGALGAMRGDQGARSILRSGLRHIESVPCPRAAFDVDTELDAVGTSDAGPPQRP